MPPESQPFLCDLAGGERVTLTLAGKEYSCAPYSNWHLVPVEKLLGKSIFQILEDLGKGSMGLEFAYALLTSMLDDAGHLALPPP